MEIEFNSDGNLKVPENWKKRKYNPDTMQFQGHTDMNLAFKCTFNDKSWKGICSRSLFNHNIKNHVWCSQYEQHQCQNYKDEELSDINYPCYESVLFIAYAYSTGMYQKGEKKGEPIPIKHLQKGKIALLTTKKPNQEEPERYIFGFLDIKNFKEDKDNKGVPTGIRIYGNKDASLKIEPKIRLNFWDFYSNKANPEIKQWKTGLFRYLEDETILKFLRRLKEEYNKMQISEGAGIIEQQIKKYEEFVEGN